MGRFLDEMAAELLWRRCDSLAFESGAIVTQDYMRMPIQPSAFLVSREKSGNDKV